MRQRVEELEEMVRQLCKAVDPNIDPSKTGKFEMTAEALKRLRQATTPEARSDSFSHGTSSIDFSEPATSNNASTSMESFEDAPLLNLFKAAMLIEGNEVSGDIGRTTLSAQHRIQTCIRSLNMLIPSFGDLTSILEITERYWPLWNAFPESVLPGSDNPPTESVARMRNYIFDSMRSDCGTVVAKAVLCLALCVQQLPASFKYQRPSLPASPSALLEAYLMGAETLLLSLEDSVCTLDGLECFTMQARVYIDQGKPRNAWLCFRRAMNYALLQGLQDLDDGADVRQRRVWSHIWQYDRQISLTLGLPPAISTSHPGVSTPHPSQSLQERVMFESSVIAGHIIERNQNYRNVDYSVTEQIEQKLLDFRYGLASSLLDTVQTSSMPLETIYKIHIAKIYYYGHCKMLHLPYMLKSGVDRKYEHNRLAALEAGRETIRVWQNLRASCEPETLIICNFLDFQVFTAAITVVINLLSPSCPDDIQQQTRDWELIHDTSRNLNNVSEIMECSVACQAAQLLDYLSSAYHGTYAGPEMYEAAIPYFGKVRIRQIKKQVPFHGKEVQMNELDGFNGQEMFSNMVDFSADPFVSFSQNYMGDYLSEAELSVDWTAILNADVEYDWNQSFDCSSSAMR